MNVFLFIETKAPANCQRQIHKEECINMRLKYVSKVSLFMMMKKQRQLLITTLQPLSKF